MLGDASLVLGTLVGGPGTTTVACLGGAQVDRFGNVNSTEIPGGPFLVGSGGGNDVASVCAEAVVVATLTPQRTPPECGYVTSPGRAVQALVTDLATFEKPAPLDRSTFVLTALAPGVTVEDVRVACGWDLEVAGELSELAAPTAEEIAALRTWDPRGWFLRP
jgi:acyl CoA:acetate/3-ketoacid CoA transferase beta subunit